ncbi:hypothetical protein [Acidocella aminolytica]|uniref:Uncharacterized protein n=1 Tax=Acidocella aminolytica 101 = DSM 11237 TaxID=1120923 RepID=A0A0D6PKU8_9PROT|nr:hypothetical protein [Acidocella aminolytica]GAN82041.1 hypothetical protein Aam_146_006 [Acidocella aminolytica 101 = DSM 11237]GBQ42899.1 hypothetical protein AA11237_3106 [Acidocella aminolytica 101 = DSM 11237]SHE30215.1 hypothetical protein SAMN02746095_00067 [Acidocella aminolytica 101 = DSM 11237]
MSKRTKREPATELERAAQALHEAQQNLIRKTGELAIRQLGQNIKMAEVAGAIKYALDHTTKEERVELGEEWFRGGTSTAAGRNTRGDGGDAGTQSRAETPEHFTNHSAEPWDDPHGKLI